MKHFLSAGELSRDAALSLFSLAADLKNGWKSGRRPTPLTGRTFALIFEKPSLRTRVTFEVGVNQLGGRAVYLAGQEIGLGTRESVPDVARNLSRWVDGICARVFSHATIDALATNATVPVINMLSDFEHPCQAVADYFTLWERGVDFAKVRIAWVGDGNNVCHSIVLLGAALGADLRVACPPGYEPDPAVMAAARARGGSVTLTTEPDDAVRGADVVYTDVWTSMGQEAEKATRQEAFARYQVNGPLLNFAKSSALVMHCLPAHRGEEITDDVLDGPRSVALDQAENRLHAQKAIIAALTEGLS
ncbi:MAG: ornithine carbamoyltransferase [Candidatus Rokubacteria bacterium]|nr:ornithine carbamoyltransferase [Candidatus Rokubacteria bacterium]